MSNTQKLSINSATLEQIENWTPKVFIGTLQLEDVGEEKDFTMSIYNVRRTAVSRWIHFCTNLKEIKNKTLITRNYNNVFESLVYIRAYYQCLMFELDQSHMIRMIDSVYNHQLRKAVRKFKEYNTNDAKVLDKFFHRFSIEEFSPIPLDFLRDMKSFVRAVDSEGNYFNGYGELLLNSQGELQDQKYLSEFLNPKRYWVKYKGAEEVPVYAFSVVDKVEDLEDYLKNN